jgi:hypothetical protein
MHMLNRVVAAFALGISLAGSSALAANPLEAWVAPRIDFSHAGYHGGGVVLPLLPAMVVVEPDQGDDGERIMAAIDLVSRLPPDAQGRRGVVQLAGGDYQVEGQLRIAVGGVVLRGADSTITATGHDRRTLIAVRGEPGPTTSAETRAIVADVEAGAVEIRLESVEGLSVGQRIAVRRLSTEGWIKALGMDAFVGWRPESRLNWKPGSRDIVWDRVITAIDGDRVVLDAPLTTALETAHGGGVLETAPSTKRIAEVGIENLKLVSAHDPSRPADEDHSWTAISLDNVEDAWVRDVAAEGFAGSMVDVGASARRITVQDVSASAPVSEIGGLRRRVFYTVGQQTLFLRCTSEEGVHDFGVGHAAAGPNAFVDCVSQDAHGDSGTLESWASGVLFDGVKVRGGGLNLTHRGRDGQGVGWSAANSVLWNCEATDAAVRNPPGALNAAIGCRGELSGDGIREDPRVQPGRDFHRAAPQTPASLYRAQLEARLGAGALTALDPVVAPALSSHTPRLTDARVAAYRARNAAPLERRPLTVENGRFVIDGRPAWSRGIGFSFFQAQMVPALAPAVGPFITRFAPGLEGVGLTDDLDALAASLETGDVVTHNYGLWYDRRRVDHDFYGSPDQKDGEVWGPFIELPWARSGQGRAWDGLSKFDLTRFNPWFFDRVAAFADKAEQRGVVLYHRLYLQHWLLESRSHYVDFPWRPVNALQETGMPNEVPAAETFWDVSDPVRRDLHRRYIRHTLDSLKGRTNAVIGLDPEYTGPLSFVRFWLDEIAAWEAETGADVRVALEAPKDQIDAVLDDPARAAVIDAIGFHHWTYRPDGSLFAIQGGLNKAPREQVDAIARSQDLPPGADAGEVRRTLWRSTPAMRYRAYREYRDRDADLVVLNADDAFPGLSFAVETSFLAEARAGLRVDRPAVPPTGDAWGSSDADGAVLVYSVAGAAVDLLEAATEERTVQWTANSNRAPITTVLLPGEGRLVPPPEIAGLPWAAWVRDR